MTNGTGRWDQRLQELLKTNKWLFFPQPTWKLLNPNINFRASVLIWGENLLKKTFLHKWPHQIQIVTRAHWEMPPDTCKYINPPLSRISPRPRAWSCCDTEDSGRKLSLTWELKGKRDTFEPSHIQLHQISRKHRIRSRLQYNRLPPRKSDIKNTIESWPQFQFLFRKREFM